MRSMAVSIKILLPYRCPLESMQYQIQHLSHYHYSQPVCLAPHTLRLCPRSDGGQWLQQFELSITPNPAGQNYSLDAQGNVVIQLWFLPEPTPALSIQTHCQVETRRHNPFDYLLEPWAAELPLDYPISVVEQLYPYLQSALLPGLGGALVDWVQQLLQAAGGQLVPFLFRLNQAIYEGCDYRMRPTGAPQQPAVTLAQRQGTCRDFVVLMMAACRAVGLAARFVSGYQAGDPDQQERDLHAWVEVYVPGAGWRGYDPTLGLAVADGHVAIASAIDPRQAAPVTGKLRQTGDIQTRLETQISLEAIP
jgi:transglutaminase-like putative cysteine protease